MTLQEQIDFCKKKMASGGAEFKMYRALVDTLIMAEKFDLFPKEIDGHIYQQFVGVYFEFRRSRGSEPKMTPQAGKALKTIIRYLLKNEKVSGDPEKALTAWRFILEKWNHLSDFLRSQVSLSGINNNIEEIIEQLTNVSKKAKQRNSENEREQLARDLKKRWS